MQRFHRPFAPFAILLLVFIPGACQPITPPTPVPAITEENKAIVQRYLEEVWNQGDVAVADELVVADFVDHAADPGQAPGIEGVKQAVAGIHTGFPDFHVTVEDMIAEEDKVVTRFTARGTHQGEFAGLPPTDKQVEVAGILIDRLVDGKIVEEWENFDELGFLTQLGVIPSSEEAAQPAAEAEVLVEAETVITSLNAPMGVLVSPDGKVWVIDSGVGGDTDIPFIDPNTSQQTTAKAGETARVVQVASDGTQTDVANLPSVLVGMEPIGGARLALLNGTLYATNGAWIDGAGVDPIPNTAAIVKIEDGQVTEVAPTWVLEKDQNPDGFILESHPYHLTAGPDGNLWVVDAGANDLLKIDPATGQVELVAVFQGVSSPLPNPSRGGAMESDPVPTGVAFAQDGNLYVSLLPGFPFLPGSAKVVQITPDGQVTDYATGLTMLTDLRTGPDGNLYAVQIGQFTEQGPVPNSGAIIRVKAGDTSEVVVDGLSFPTSIDFSAAGDAYVTINGGFSPPGSGEVVLYKGLTKMAGRPLP